MNYQIPNILNNQVNTIALFKCTQRKYADSFIKGDIFFNTPGNWIQEEKKGNKGRGDILEGTCFSYNKFKKGEYDKKFSEEKYELFRNNGYTFVRNKGILDLYCTCFYGLNKDSFKKRNLKNVKKNDLISIIDKSYFQNFSENLTEEQYNKTPKNNQPVVITINNPHEFKKRIIKALKKIGLSENEIIFYPVTYINKNTDFNEKILFPYELLLKDKYFANQNEIRLVINSKKENVINYIKEHNNVINIGPLDDITNVLEFYFKNMEILKLSETEYVYTLPKPERIYLNPILDDDFDDISKKIIRFVDNLLPIKMTREEQSELKNIYNYAIEKKYSIRCIPYTNNLTIYKDKDEKVVYKRFHKFIKSIKKQKHFEKKLSDYVNKNQIENIKIESKKYKNIKKYQNLACFYEANYYENQENYNKAIEKYTHCINNKLNEEQSLRSRIQCFVNINKYTEAIEDLKKLEKITGPDSLISIYIANSLIYLNKLDEAIEKLNYIISKEATNASAFYNRSVAYFKKSNYLKAKEDILTAIKIDSNNNFYKEQYDLFYKTI